MQKLKVAVIGAGPVGLVGAYHLVQKGFSVDLFDPFLFQIQNEPNQPNEQINNPKSADIRYISLSYGSIALLESIGIDISHLGQPIEAVHISTESFWGACTMRATENNVPALAYSIHYQDLQNALLEKLRHLNQKTPHLLNCISAKVEAYENTLVSAGSTPIQSLNELAYVVYHMNSSTQTQTPTARLTSTYHHIFVCEGGVFNANSSYNFNANTSNKFQDAYQYKYKDQQQNAYIGFLNLNQSHHDYAKCNHESAAELSKTNMAWECFTKEGPLAILPYHAYPNPLPLVQATHVIVWCQNREQKIFKQPITNIRDLRKMSLQTDFATKLTMLISKLQGFVPDLPSTQSKKNLTALIAEIQWQQGFELGSRYRSILQNQHISFLGNSAQIMHPVAGQGLNLGLRQILQATCDFITHIQAHQLKIAEQIKEVSSSLNINALKQHDFIDFSPYRLNQMQINQDRKRMLFLTQLMAKGFEKQIFSTLFSAGMQFVNGVPFLKQKLAHIFMYGGRG
jgi:2-octaprenyl-6-methoxyphenol hydroxylase